MRLAIVLLAALFQLVFTPPPITDGQAGDSTVPATATHHIQKYVQTDDFVERTCPEGYEGHFVDPHDGFFADAPVLQLGEGQAVFAVCFKKDFMDKLRKNPDALMVKPTLRAM